jgi:hypothetical protein
VQVATLQVHNDSGDRSPTRIVKYTLAELWNFLQEDLATEQVVVEEKKSVTQMLIESIGKEKSVVDEAVESSRADEEAASALSVSAVPLQNQSTQSCS